MGGFKNRVAVVLCMCMSRLLCYRSNKMLKNTTNFCAIFMHRDKCSSK